MLSSGSLVSLMATRLVLSLKKAGNLPHSPWNLGDTSQLGSIKFAGRMAGGTEYDGDIILIHLSSERSSVFTRDDQSQNHTPVCVT